MYQANGDSGLLNRDHVRKAVRAVSKNGRFRYTLRNVYYKLLRDGAWPEPAGDDDAALQTFECALEEYEEKYGVLPGRIRAVDLPPEPNLGDLHEDIADYTVRRIIVFDRVEPFLVFAANGFHQRIEIGLALWPDYPLHIWKMHERHPDLSTERTFYVVHDCTRDGYALTEQVRKFVADNELPDNVVDVGLRFIQASNLGLPIRTEANRAGNGRVADWPETMSAGDADEARLMFRAGHFTHLEELSPLQMLRWAYRRVAKRSQDIGFG